MLDRMREVMKVMHVAAHIFIPLSSVTRRSRTSIPAKVAQPSGATLGLAESRFILAYKGYGPTALSFLYAAQRIRVFRRS